MPACSGAATIHSDRPAPVARAGRCGI